LIIYRSGVELI